MLVEHWTSFPEMIDSIEAIYSNHADKGHGHEACLAASAAALAMNREILAYPSVAIAMVEHFLGSRAILKT